MRTRAMLLGVVLLLVIFSGCGQKNPISPTSEMVISPTETAALPVEPTPAEPSVVEAAETLAGLPLADFFEQGYQMLLARDPEAMLELGLVADPDAPQVLTDFSLAYEQETSQLCQTLLELLHKYDYASLASFDQVSYQVFDWYLTESIQKTQDADYIYLVNPLSVRSYPQLFIMFFTETHPLATPADAEGYVARIHWLDEKIEALIERMEAQEAAGIIPPRMVIEYGRMDIKNFLGYSYNASPLRSAFLNKTAEIAALDEETRSALADELLAALKEEVFPAFDHLDAFLSDLQAKAPEMLGLSAYAGGEAYYNRLLHTYTTTDLTAEEVHAQGLAELERIQSEMRQRFADLGYPVVEGFPALYARLEDESGTVSGAAVAEEYERVLSLANEQVSTYFDLRPEGELEVVGGNAGNYYSPGSLDGSRPGKFFAITTGSQPLFKIKTIAYHEGIPGHHFQIMGPKQGDLPFFRFLVNFDGYVEGWALYAEYLASEMGWYADDPAGDLGRLQYEALRAARMVVDTGIHTRDWGFEQAVDFMWKNTGLPRGVLEYEVIRYISYPGQAPAYLIGKMEIMRMRTEAQEAQGDAFDLRQFHNVVLGNGSMPLATLDEVIGNWTAQVLNN